MMAYPSPKQIPKIEISENRTKAKKFSSSIKYKSVMNSKLKAISPNAIVLRFLYRARRVGLFLFIMATITWSSITKSKIRALTMIEKSVPTMPRHHLIVEFPLKVIKRLHKQIRNRAILLRKMKTHSRTLWTVYTRLVTPEGWSL